MSDLSLVDLRKDWEHIILDAGLDVVDLACLDVGDIDGDGKEEMVVGGNGGLFWYRPATAEKGVIAGGRFHVGLCLEDVDGDGTPEIVIETGRSGGKVCGISWFKPDGKGNWQEHVIDPRCAGSAHDMLFHDIDGDGKKELVAVAFYTSTPGLFAYKPGKDPKKRWKKHALSTGYAAEGLAAADVDGDGRAEIVQGPSIFYPPSQESEGGYHAGASAKAGSPPRGGAFKGEWERREFAPGFREMVRAAALDITGNGRPDIVLAESEYTDGRMSWFENRGRGEWAEHELERGLVFAHSLQARKKGKETRLFLAEMAAGGWEQPWNHEARLMEYVSADKGVSWRKEIISVGQGSHQALMHDLDGDGEAEVAGKEWGNHLHLARVHYWKKAKEHSPLRDYRHRFLDRAKPYTAVEIMASDVDGDGKADVVCGAWWYRNGDWKRYEIPGIYQVINRYDLDGDGREEYIALRGRPGAKDAYSKMCSKVCWLKPLDPVKGKWECHDIGEGSGDWPHGSVVGPFGKDGGAALVLGYHDADEGGGHTPEIFAMPEDATKRWKRRPLCDVKYGEEMIAHDVNGNGKVDIIAGPWLFENRGDKGFKAKRILGDFKVARLRLMDVNKNGRWDIVAGEEVLDYSKGYLPWSRLAWFECPANPLKEDWRMHVIDKVRCGHSVEVADLDGDGELEIICGEHDPFKPYRSRCRLMVYKKADAHGRAWKRYVLDDRFEHHDGAIAIELGKGKMGIVSHAWQEPNYVHLWAPQE